VEDGPGINVNPDPGASVTTLLGGENHTNQLADKRKRIPQIDIDASITPGVR
jgi:hypothetical protein